MQSTLMMTPIEQAVYEVAKQNLGTKNLWQDMIALAEQGVLKAMLEATNGNQTEAATLLGMNRITLRTRVERYQLKHYGKRQTV